MASSFFDRIDELKERVGKGKLTGRVKFDQVYASAQETGTWTSGPNAGKVIHEHPGGGQSHFLGGALLEGKDVYLRSVASSVLDEGGPAQGMREAAEELAKRSSGLAPIEFGDLRESAHPTVESEGAVVFDRPPHIPRLTKEQLKAKDKLRRQGNYARTYLPEDHPSHGTVHPHGAGGAG